MTLERWKLLAGVFGIAIVGLVAMANPQCPGKTDPTREKAPPTREIAARPVDPPQSIVAGVPKSDPTPVLPEIAIVVPSPKVEPQTAVPALSVSRKAESVIEIPLPGVVPAPVYLPPTADNLKLELPRIDAVAQPAPPTLTLAPLPSPAPSAAPPKATTPPPAIVPVEPIKARPTVEPATTALAPTPFLEPLREVPAIKEEVETRVRVVVPLGKSQAKFEVLTGDTVLLQAVCESVEVRSPGDKVDKGSAASPIRASGKVRFTAPGCEGTCDTLAVLPGTGEVELTGTVRVVCKHGKAETEIQATTMKFKLGSSPSVVPVSAKGY